ncbi:MAG: hypothetical protein HLUCCX10_05665 [Algoriphagus marincola HL-49]|uniref:Lipoprotein n=1 Tax=Algoriphagus marincola HL-49 TaxID=1305737 RepID=A0A0P7YRS4_9BACT|nr:MAG: hypothetical protein HLUCCX10_05665 [Algoriphagus marincola HL-49]
MKKIKSLLTLGLAFSFLAATTLTSCGGKKEESQEATTEQPAESSEHPSDGGEHPSDSSEHPSEGGEHPTDGGEHPDNS